MGRNKQPKRKGKTKKSDERSDGGAGVDYGRKISP